ncbi:MAG: RecX family transcriptional regulator [Bacteroidia bacterium]|nr:RecX family transcriptional regulator [Bacteroidia bacterium]
MLTKEEIIHKITKWCAYQDRSEFETIEKMMAMGVNKNEIPDIIEYLREENYLNEERFVKNYIEGKLNLKKWGLKKVKYLLKQKYRVPDELINKHISTISKEHYLSKLKDIIARKKQLLEKKEKDQSVLKKKIINFALSKGYDISDIYEVINELKM